MEPASLDYQTCYDVDECSLGIHRCDVNSECINNMGKIPLFILITFEDVSSELAVPQYNLLLNYRAVMHVAFVMKDTWETLTGNVY